MTVSVYRHISLNICPGHYTNIRRAAERSHYAHTLSFIIYYAKGDFTFTNACKNQTPFRQLRRPEAIVNHVCMCAYVHMCIYSSPSVPLSPRSPLGAGTGCGGRPNIVTKTEWSLLLDCATPMTALMQIRLVLGSSFCNLTPSL